MSYWQLPCLFILIFSWRRKSKLNTLVDFWLHDFPSLIIMNCGSELWSAENRCDCILYIMVWWRVSTVSLARIFALYSWIITCKVLESVGLVRPEVKLGSTWTSTCPLKSPTSVAIIIASSKIFHRVSSKTIRHVMFLLAKILGCIPNLMALRCSPQWPSLQYLYWSFFWQDGNIIFWRRARNGLYNNSRWLIYKR